MSITPVSPAINQQGRVQTWVTSRWKNPSIPGQFSAEINRHWLTVTPQLPPGENAAAHTRGLKRFDGFVQTLGLRLQQGNSFLSEIPDDIAERPTEDL